MRTLIAAALLAIVPAVAPAKPARSHAVKSEFQREHPCPTTGQRRGACPGWQIDHVTPLKCGGRDHPSNLQWLTVAEHKAKTAREARLCRRSK